MPDIPDRLHQFWCNPNGDDTPPADVREVMQRTRELLVDRQYQPWDSGSIEALLDQRMPELLSLFRALTIPAMKSDIARLVVLYAFGGLAITHVNAASWPSYQALKHNCRLLVCESRDKPEVIANRMIVGEAGNLHCRSVIDICAQAVTASIQRGDRRLEFAEGLALFTRHPCSYKHDPLGNWQALQRGESFPIYRGQD